MKRFAWTIRLFAVAAVLAAAYVWIDTAPAQHQGPPKYRLGDDRNLPPVIRSPYGAQPAIWTFECINDKDCGEPQYMAPYVPAVVVTPIPEPDTLLLVVPGLILLAARIRR